MMTNGNENSRRSIVEGKGFYIVLGLCLTIIAVSAWSLWTEAGIEVFSDDSVTVSEDTSMVVVVTSIPTVEPVEDDLEPNTDTMLSDSEVPADAERIVVNLDEPQVQESVEIFDTLVPTDYIYPVTGDISMSYSMEALVFSDTLEDWRVHAGVDFEVAMGEKVFCAANGVVTAVYDDALLGRTVIVDHGEGIETVYANLAKETNVEVGDIVNMGDILGEVGDTAISEANEPSHIHFEMRINGENVNPMDYLPER